MTVSGCMLIGETARQLLPATSDPRFTSVGTLAIRRFLRPLCYRDAPAARRNIR